MAIVSYTWYFGDGHISAEKSPVHTYVMPGTYTWTVIVEDHLGNTASDSGSVIVTGYGEASGELNVSRTDTSYRYAVRSDQGIGFSKNANGDWPMPEAYVASLQIINDNNQPINLVLDYETGQYYDITTRDSYAGSGLAKVWKDKVATDGTGGTDIGSVVRFGQDRGNYEHYFLNHLESHIYTRPQDESSGYPAGLEIDTSIYVDGEPTTATATAADVPVDGDIVYDTELNGHRLQTEVSMNVAEAMIVGRQQYYKAMDKPDDPDNRIMTEDDYQTNLGSAILWLTRGPSLMTNRYDGSLCPGTVTATSGPDGLSASAMQFTATLTPGSYNVSGGTIMCWYQSLISITLNGVPISLTTHSTSGSWTLGYATGITQNGNLVITPNTTGKLFDLRLFTAYTVSAAERASYFDSVVNHTGLAYLPM